MNNAVEFVRSIGLEVREGRPNQEPSFNPDSYVWLHKGRLYYDPEKFHIGDFLHEAGHLAVLPSIARPFATGEIEESTSHAIVEYLNTHQDSFFDQPEDPIARACLQAGDAEAIAWSYAAAVKLEIDPVIVFENGFPTDEDRADVQLSVSMNAYPGINGLRAGGFFKSVKDYPRMERWLAP